MVKTNPKDALEDMASALKKVFKDYSLSSRRQAWEKLTKGKGKDEMDKMILYPSRPVHFSKLNFKDWMSGK
jgi:hypothetical protein